jgi:glycosyltransferase involved in cell wall biosynthesis
MNLHRNIPNNGFFANEPLVSILMLTYNRAHFIGEAIDSVMAQTYPHWELIIIDDGSTDETAEVVQTYHDSRIRYIQNKENKGILARRQDSLTYVSGAYAAVLDSDDVWLDTTKLARQVEYLEQHPACVLVGTFITIRDEKGTPLGFNKYHTTDTSIRSHILLKNQFAHSSVLLRASALTKVPGYRLPLDEDLDLFLQLGMIGTFANIPLFATGYRAHSAGVSHNRAAMVKQVLAILTMHKQHYPHFIQSYIKYWLYSVYLALRSANKN